MPFRLLPQPTDFLTVCAAEDDSGTATCEEDLGCATTDDEDSAVFVCAEDAGFATSDEDDSTLSVEDEGSDDTLDAGLPSNDNPDDDDTDSSSSNDDIEQEAFILTAKNINSELDVNIRNCLGILNEADISSTDIFKKFKKASKKLNRVSAKASNMSKVYTDDERKTIGDMNKALVNLTLELGSASKDVASIKEKMKAFVNAAAAVGKIVETKKN